ncbi:hypothetical protein D9757_000600 [Collybiopsis confluens]|uniref:Enoyl reductase (ER) domain-containing protein n=1 Tax=Collybiopsis confluens TaxID=2823264 RepID=A0A8H5I1X9_9AGAR|nr:hypothetical protein D9757_000600 [Collybiopsis confluens]
MQTQGKHQNKPHLPFVLGAEFAGRIAENSPIPPGCPYKPGDRVFGAGQGAFAEKMVANVASTLPLPDALTYDEAAGKHESLYVTWPTSYEGLVGRAQMKPVLGGKVIAAAGSEAKLDIAKSKGGADYVVDYSKPDWPKEVLRITGGKGVDVVYDPVGLVQASLKCIAWKGRVIVVGFAAGSIEKIPMNLVLLKNISLVGIHWGAYTKNEPKRSEEVWKALLNLFTSGKVKPVVYHEIFPLERLSEGLTALENRKTYGKVIVTMKKDKDAKLEPSLCLGEDSNIDEKKASVYDTTSNGIPLKLVTSSSVCGTKYIGARPRIPRPYRHLTLAILPWFFLLSTMAIHHNTLLFLCVFILFVGNNGVFAFGAGNIPSFAYLEGKAFRHGDIEDTLADLLKKAGGAGLLGAVMNKGSKFNGLDVKAVDIAGLKKLPLTFRLSDADNSDYGVQQTIMNLVMVLGFLAHGYATHEFEVTVDRLAVYLPTEHIDNPKGYGEGEDARRYDPRLRGPVDPRELEIDRHTGMKNYIANESGNWDTSKALIRRTLERCIHLGRQHRAQNNKHDLYEAYRLLGQALHTLEDFPAHSNFTELSLVSMGHSEVFCQVGDQVRIPAPGGRMVAPIVTGTFGGSDFMHSLLGEATDHLSQASVTDLNKEFDKARSKQQRSGPGSSDPASMLRGLFLSVPGGTGSEMSREMESVERIRAGPQQGGKRPEDLSPQELHSILWQVRCQPSHVYYRRSDASKVLTFRDSVAKKIEKTIGLGPLIEKLMDSVSVFVFTTLEPFVKPLLQTATNSLSSVSGEVINNQDQYEVFNDPRANLILNEPAGNLAKIIVANTVNLIVKAWDDNNVNVHSVTEDVLSCLYVCFDALFAIPNSGLNRFHPDFHNRSSKIQTEMLQYMQSWVQQLGSKQHSTLSRLTKDAVRDGGAAQATGTYAYNQGTQAQHNIQDYAASHIPGVAQAQSMFNKFDSGIKREGPGPSMATTRHEPPRHHVTGPPPVSSGESGSFYSSSAGSPYPQPSGPPPGGAGYGSYAPPTPAFPDAFSGAPPQFPDAGGYGEYQHHQHDQYSHHYAPQGAPGGFAPPPGPPGVVFPDSSPYMPHGDGPAFPGAESYSQGGPQFPNANAPPSGGYNPYEGGGRGW